MPKARRTSYNLAFKLKVVAEAEAVENNSEIARDYGISESMVRRWRKDQANLFNGELKMSAKRKTKILLKVIKINGKIARLIAE